MPEARPSGRKSPEERLKELGLSLPEAPRPVGSYVPCTRSGKLVFVSGMLPRKDGNVLSGRLGKDTGVEQGQEAARIALLSALSAVKEEVGTLDNIRKIVRLTGYVRSHEDFSEQHKVLDGASNLLRDIFEDRGLHSRVSIGVPELPLRAILELELVVEVT